MDALILFKNDIAAYGRVYGFLSQIFDDGNTDIEKRSIFLRLLHPLLAYGRERKGVDLSALKLTAYTIKSLGNPTLNPALAEPVKLYGSDGVGSGQVQDRAQAALAALIAKVNDLFEGDLSPGDKLVYVNDVIKGKLMASDRLAAHSAMSRQALESPALRADLKAVLLGAGQLWQGLRAKAGGGGTAPQAPRG